MWVRSDRVTSTEKWRVSASKFCSPLGCSWTTVSLQSPQPRGHATQVSILAPSGSGGPHHLLAQPRWVQPGLLHMGLKAAPYSVSLGICTRCGCPTALLGPLICHRVLCPHAPAPGGAATPGSPQKDIMWWVLIEGCCWSEAEESPQRKWLLLDALPVTHRWLSWVRMQIHSCGAWRRHRGNFKIERFTSCFC